MTLSNATHLEVEAGVRYWEDATVNGIQATDDAPLIYGADGGTWRIKLRLADGKIEGWPDGVTAKVHYKVCDDGEYWLADDSGKRIAKWQGFYVPDDYLCHGGDGYGDYIIFTIGGDGLIAGFVKPELDYERWEILP